MSKEKAQKEKSKNLKIASVIATLVVTSAVGLIQINKDHIKVATIGTEEVYVTEDTSFEDLYAYIDMVNYEIQQMGGEVTLEDVEFINGDVSEKSVIAKLNSKIMRREPEELTDVKEKKKYKLSRDILMKKSEQISIDYLLEVISI